MSSESQTAGERAWGVPVALAVGLALLAATIAVTLSRSPLVLTGTNRIPPSIIVAKTTGGASACQNRETIPQGTTAVRLWLTGNVKPSVRISLVEDSRTVASGQQQSGWLGKVVTVPVGSVSHTIDDAQLCFAIGRTAEAVDLLGGPVQHPRRGESPGKIRVEYLRPGPSSWWSLAHSVARHLGLGRAPAGSWVFLLPLSAMALAALLVSLAILKELGRRLRPSVGPMWVCAAVACLSAASWSIITPPFEVTDEPSHFAYTQILAETGSLPKSHSAVFSVEQLTAMRDLDQRGVHFNPAVGTISTAAQQQRLQHDLQQPLSRVGQGAAVAGSQPPLYYALEAIPYKLAASGTLLDQLELMRLLSALMAGLTAIFTYLFLREALPRTPWAWTVGALCTALAPLLGFISGAINPDALLATVSAALFYTLARAFRHGLTPTTAAAIGATTAIGFLTKLNFIGLTPGILIALLLLTHRAAKTSKRNAYRSLALATTIALAPVGIYAIANLLSNHPGLGLASNGIADTNKHTGTTLDEINYIWQTYLPRLPGTKVYFPGVSTTRQLWFDRLVGLYGWLDTHFPDWVYNAALVPTALLAGLCLRELVRVRTALRPRLAELVSYAALAVGLLVLIAASSYLEFPGTVGGYAEPRYMLPLAALFAAVLALAARGAGRRFGPAVGTLIVVLFLGYDIFSQLQVVARFYGS